MGAPIDPTKLRPGMKIVCEGQLWMVTSYDHRTPGNLRSFVVCKLKNIQDGRVVERTWRGAAEPPEQADFDTRTCQYLYKDADGHHFMDLTTYDQFQIPDEILGLAAAFLIPETEVIVGFWDSKAMGVELPPKMVFTVADTYDDIARGNSSGNITKEATLETGMKIQVPALVKTGDKVRVSTDDGSYVERA
jgi:elongation factor P